jgi:predicted transcriptional regulator
MAPTLKTTVYLDPATYRQLKIIAKGQGASPAALLRKAVAELVAREAKARRPRSLGAGRSGRGDLSERAEELLKGMGRKS